MTVKAGSWRMAAFRERKNAAVIGLGERGAEFEENRISHDDLGERLFSRGQRTVMRFVSGINESKEIGRVGKGLHRFSSPKR